MWSNKRRNRKKSEAASLSWAPVVSTCICYARRPPVGPHLQPYRLRLKQLFIPGFESTQKSACFFLAVYLRLRGVSAAVFFMYARCSIFCAMRLSAPPQRSALPILTAKNGGWRALAVAIVEVFGLWENQQTTQTKAPRKHFTSFYAHLARSTYKRPLN